MCSIPEEMKEDIQILQNNAFRSCFNIIDPIASGANITELHHSANLSFFRHRMMSNLLICIRNSLEMLSKIRP